MGTGGRDSWWGTFERPQSCSRSSGQGSSRSGVGDPSAEPPEAQFHIRPAPRQAAHSSEHHCTGSPRREAHPGRPRGPRRLLCPSARLRGRACTLRPLRCLPTHSMGASVSAEPLLIWEISGRKGGIFGLILKLLLKAGTWGGTRGHGARGGRAVPGDHSPSGGRSCAKRLRPEVMAATQQC